MTKIAKKTNTKNTMMRYCLNAGLALTSLFLVGCKDRIMYVPPTLNESKIQVEQTSFLEDVFVHDVDDAYIGAVARHYTKHGGSPMDIVITYDPRSSGNTAMYATNKASDITTSFRDYGISDIKTQIMPVKSLGDHARMMISYDAYSARAPEGCDEDLPGMNGTILETNSDYKLGCTSQSLMAKQIAKPKHLLGQGSSGSSDGRSASNIVDAYRTGAPNQPLDGQSATGE